ncbi:MAG: FAD-dependent monooxygenase [Beijerinckiaceae bacterium]
MADKSSQAILVAGAGIAGLTSAIALARAGFDVRLIERATRFEEIGAGLQLSPNASRVLIELGLGAAVARQAATPHDLAIRRLTSERVIASMPMNNAQDRFDSPFWTILRADLQTALIDAARGERRIAFLVGRTLDDARSTGNGVSVNVRTSSGGLERIEGSALIGADGLWSRVRPIVGEAAQPRYIGYEAWRALLPAADAPPDAMQDRVNLAMGRDAHLVHYPVAGGRLVNIVLVKKALSVRDDSRLGGWSAPGDPAELQDIVKTMKGPMRDLVASVASWQTWSLFDLGPLATWSRDRITIVGDAAHPTPPFLAQGAALAIEDAAILAQEAARTPEDFAGALRRYADRRRARAARVQRASQANERNYHARGLIAIARDLVIARLGGNGMLRRYQWLYGWTPDS